MFYPILKKMVKVSSAKNDLSISPVVSIYSIPVTDIQGRTDTLEAFRGKKMLIVNTASECGYTPQYEALQSLHQRFGDKIAVLAFPCNDFGGQEPAEEITIHAFCQARYGVTFPLFSKIHVVGIGQHPLYAWLSDAGKNGWNSEVPTWNFCKYLIDEEGKLLYFFNASFDPLDKLITG